MGTHWHIGVDTGGTFTDALGVDPFGTAHRVKVLSTGAVRARANGGGKRLVVEGLGGLPPGLLAGWRVGSPGASAREGSGVRVVSSEGGVLDLEREHAGGIVELTTGEPAPVLAARLLTGTPRGAAWPMIRMRLATTRGTNALLERRVSRVAMVLTRGLEDLLRIGTQQRADLFALRIERPEPLYEVVVGAPGRIGARGEVLEALDLDAVERGAREAIERGIDHAAVALMHAWINPSHEVAVGERLRALGMKHVSLSHEMSGTIKILERASAALVNAALAGPVGAFLERVRTALGPGSTLEVMTSGAGLSEACSFHPRDSLLSGPAAGVLAAGACAPGRAVITFDMGGTSSDVARRGRGKGELEYAFEQRVGGVALAGTCVAIESVASGGGSIVGFDRGEIVVGPRSAGASPGPACYGGGGPLTITDANLLLGRLDPGCFQVPLDGGAARSRADELLARVEGERGEGLSREGLLGAALEIVNEHMAEAIRAVSIRRGHDAREHALVAFGGAGPQHACDLAERLGITRIVIPAEASLLSASGLFLAERTRVRERQVLGPLEVEGLRALAGALAGAHAGACEVLVSVRPSGQEAGVVVRGLDEIEGAFARRYREVFGHEPPDRPLEVEWVRVILTEPAEWSPPGERARGTGAGPRRGWRFWHAGGWMDASRVDRASLAPGERVEAPAIIADERSCIVLTPGWRAMASPDGGLELARDEGACVAPPTAGAREEILSSRLGAMAVEMGEQLRRTAVSTNVKERLDFSCAILDSEGRLVVNAPHVPVHLGSLGVCVRSLMEMVEMGPGDAVVTNHPGVGGSHLPDITVVTPVFDDAGERVAFVASRAHHAEIGGTRPGSMPPGAKSLAEEGVVIPPMHLVRGGVSCLEEVAGRLLGAAHPTRSIGDNLADLRAALAANRRGQCELEGFVRVHSTQGLRDAMGAIYRRAARLAARALASRPGEWRAVEALDDGSPLCVRIEVGDGKGGSGWATFDFSGSGRVHPGNLNATPAIVRSCVLYALRVLIDEPIPLNEGILDRVRIVLPEGMLNPAFDLGDVARCPAVAAGNTETSQRLVGVILRALGVAADSQGTMNNVLFGNERFAFYETIAGGAGAGPGFHGASGVHTHMTNTRITDPEVLEQRYPVVLERFALRAGSGGVGRWRGGDGVTREVRFLESVHANVLGEHRVSGPAGLEGGSPGSPGRDVVVRADGRVEVIGAMRGVDLGPGDRIVVETPGGGGFGEIFR